MKSQYGYLTVNLTEMKKTRKYSMRVSNDNYDAEVFVKIKGDKEQYTDDDFYIPDTERLSCCGILEFQELQYAYLQNRANKTLSHLTDEEIMAFTLQLAYKVSVSEAEDAAFHVISLVSGTSGYKAFKKLGLPGFNYSVNPNSCNKLYVGILSANQIKKL